MTGLPTTRRSRFAVLLALAGALLVPAGSLSQAASAPVPGAEGFRASLIGVHVVVEGGGELRLVELPEDGLLYGPGGDMNPPTPNPGAPSTPRGVLLKGAVQPGPGCGAVPQVRGVEGFGVLCPLQPGGKVEVRLGDGDDRLQIDGGTHERYYGDVYRWLGARLEVSGGAGSDRIGVQSLAPARIDGGPGDDRISIGLSGPIDTLLGGPGDDSFAYGVTEATEVSEYDLTPEARTRRVDLKCGSGADFVRPHPRFRPGAGCPPAPPRLTGRPVTVRGRKGRVVVTVRNRTPRAVTLRSVRLAIYRVMVEDEPDRQFLTLARRSRLHLRGRGRARIAISARRRGSLNFQLAQYAEFGATAELDLTGTIVDSDGDRTTAAAHVPLRRRR